MIKHIPQNPLFKISYPVVVALPIVISLVKHTGHHLVIADTFYAVFFSGVLLFLSYLVYVVAAPEEIILYKNKQEFMATKRDSIATAFPDLKIQIVLAHLPDFQQTSREKILALDAAIRACSSATARVALEHQLEDLLAPLLPGCIDRHLEREWRTIDHCRKFPLYSCWFFFLAAVGLSLFVMIERIITVIKYAFIT